MRVVAKMRRLVTYTPHSSSTDRLQSRANVYARARMRVLASAGAILAAFSSIRGTHAREFPGSTSTTSSGIVGPSTVTCAHVHADAHVIADDRGYSCAWYDLDANTGCCRAAAMEESTRYGCEGCDASVSCCDVYETCVTCCLSPTHDVDAAMRRHARGRNQVITGFFTVAFEYCKSRCRTQPGVIFHENTYAYDTTFCFGDYPTNEDPVPVKGRGKKSFAGDSPDES